MIPARLLLRGTRPRSQPVISRSLTVVPFPVGGKPTRMGTADYRFVTRWRVRGQITDVADVISDAEGLPRWWPAVYLDVRELEAGEPSGVGKVIDLYTRGWLPYTLRWRFRVTESDYPANLAIEATGDFSGAGRWTFAQDGDFTDVTYDWRIRANKPLLRRLSWLMKPIFSANHRWAMARGRESLELELARCTAATVEARLRVPDPPGPASSGRLFCLATSGLAFGVAVCFLRRHSSRRQRSAGR